MIIINDEADAWASVAYDLGDRLVALENLVHSSTGEDKKRARWELDAWQVAHDAVCRRVSRLQEQRAKQKVNDDG